MTRHFILKSLAVTIAGVVLFFLIFGIYFAHKFYNSVFRLSPDQVSSSLTASISQCEKISDCKLASGDILIRRYITPKTWSFNEFAHPYFTHSAFYLSDDQIVEAIGTEKDHKNEIKISKISKSDWLDSGMESFVIVRPKYTDGKLNRIKRNLTTIADDPDYRFGLPQFGHKQTTCANLIIEQLLNEKIATTSNLPKIITPDYLFWLAINNPNDFGIIGYNIRK